MYLVNHLNRNRTDPYFPMFEIIYSIEVISIAAALLAGCTVIYMACRCAKVPRLMRLRVICTIVMDIVYIFSRSIAIIRTRLALIPVVTSSLIFGSIMKQIFLGYMTSFLAILALDRWVATKAWAWYESDGNSTILFFALQEVIIYIIPTTNAFFALVYRHNEKVLFELKRGAVINQYSIARTYQIKENIFILSSFRRIAQPLAIACIPPFLLFPIYQRVPPNIGYDGLRYFSASVYDLWLSLASAVVIVSVPYYFPNLRSEKTKVMNVATASSFVIIDVIPSDKGDTYFSLLSNDLRIMKPKA